MKKLLLACLVLSTTLAHADSISLMECYDEKAELSFSLVYYPDDKPESRTEKVAQIIQGPQGNEVYNNYENIFAVRGNRRSKVYSGPNIKVTVNKKASTARIEAKLENGAALDTEISCDLY
jgi:hypothetical protein